MTGRRGRRRLTRNERLEIRRRVATGERVNDVAIGVDRSVRTVISVVGRAGGIPPRPEVRSGLRLSLAEREEISRGLGAGASLRGIARGLRRPPSTVSREVAANGGRRRYRAHLAATRAVRCARRPRLAKLARDHTLRAVVGGLLAARWSPQQIAWQLRHDHPDDQVRWVSHETTYQSSFVQGRGALRAELTRCLRTGRARRRSTGRARPGDVLGDMVLIPARIRSATPRRSRSSVDCTSGSTHV